MQHLANRLKVINLGKISYDRGLSLQEFAYQKVLKGEWGPTILSLEHFPVITIGRNGNEANLLSEKKRLSKLGIPVLRVDRGGEATAHTLGQLVLYPILPIFELGLGVRRYVEILEEAVIEFLYEKGIAAQRDENYPGVWCQNKKVCAVGVRIKKRVSLHGIALNINADLSVFSHIIPCGIKNRSVINLNSLTNNQVTVAEASKALVDKLSLKTHIFPVVTGDIEEFAF